MSPDPADLRLWQDAMRQGLTAFVERTMLRHVGADWRARDPIGICQPVVASAGNDHAHDLGACPDSPG